MTMEIITDAALAPLRHGFFTRRGGASSGVFAGLNCGRGSSDQAQAVAINRARVAKALGVGEDALVTPRQTHSADVAVIDGLPSRPPPRADGLVTRTPGLAIAILTADCQPVLLADRSAGVVGAAHAGWVGTLRGILEATVAAMEGLGARRVDIAAVIGPTISPAAYEVGPELRDRFVADDPDNERFFSPGTGDRLYLDLPGVGLHRLRRMGLGHVAWTGHCTYADADSFYSYRRSTHRREADYGRQISTIRVE